MGIERKRGRGEGDDEAKQEQEEITKDVSEGAGKREVLSSLACCAMAGLLIKKSKLRAAFLISEFPSCGCTNVLDAYIWIWLETLGKPNSSSDTLCSAALSFSLFLFAALAALTK